MARWWDNFMDSLQLNSANIEPDTDTEEEDEEDAREPLKKKKAIPKENTEEILPDPQKPTAKIKPSRSSNKVVQMRHGSYSSASNTMGVCIIKPIDVDNDAREITDTLLGGSAVIINLEGLNVNMAQRIIDFTAGACCAINGNLKIISSHVFIATPESVDISGDFQELLENLSNADDSSLGSTLDY